MSTDVAVAARDHGRTRRYSIIESSVTTLPVEPLLASWDSSESPSQRRLAEYKATIRALVAERLAAIDGAAGLRLVVGGNRSARGDLDNFLTPVADSLRDPRIASYAAVRRPGQESIIEIGRAVPAPPLAEAAWSFAVARTTTSSDREAWKAEVAAGVGVHRCSTGLGPIEMEIGFAVGPHRSWTNLWKPAIDALGGVLGLTDARPWHPRDDRIDALALHRAVDPALGNAVELGIWWREHGTSAA